MARLLRRPHLVVAFTILALFTLPGAASPPDPAINYDNSAGGLRHLLQDALKAAKENNQAKLRELTAPMVLPNPEDWLSSVFGPQAGAAYASRYRKGLSGMSAELADVVTEWQSQKFTDIDVTRFTIACDSYADEDEYPILAARQEAEPLSRATFRHDSFEHVLRYFAYVGGGFRYIGGLEPPTGFGGRVPSASDEAGNQNGSGPAPVKVPGNIHASRLIKGDPPTYPTEANLQHLQGDVVLHALITQEGTIAELRVIKGRCLFAKPAMDAVRKWRYTPVTVAGKPVAVDTTIDVRFALSR
jgi:TonB family protein